MEMERSSKWPDSRTRNFAGIFASNSGDLFYGELLPAAKSKTPETPSALQDRYMCTSAFPPDTSASNHNWDVSTPPQQDISPSESRL